MTEKLFGILKEAWFVALAPFMAGWWDSLSFWRILALVGWTVIVVAWYKREWLLSLWLRPEYREHDINIFAESNKLMTERDLFWYLFRLGNDHHFRDDQYDRVRNFLWFFKEQGNQYLLSRLASSSSKLIHALHKLAGFTEFNFSRYPRGQTTQYCLYPDLNIDRAGTGEPEDTKAYNEKADELWNHVCQVREADKRYRRELNHALPAIRQYLSKEATSHEA